MDFEKAFSNVMSRLVVRESDWRFVTSGGAALSVSTPIARVGVNAGGGALWVKKDADQTPTRLTYGGLGGGVGLSLVPTPANFSFSIPAMPSAGRIYKLPAAGLTLSLSEMKGPFLMIEIGGDMGPGASGALMFIGGSMLSIAAGPMQLPAFIATAEACVAFGGMTATVLPFNVGISFYVGAIL